MGKLLKNLYNQEFYNTFSSILSLYLDSFDKNKYLSEIFCEQWNTMELKERMHHNAKVLHSILPNSYPGAVKTILEIIKELINQNLYGMELEFMFFPDFIEMYGLENYQVSVSAIEEITKFASCEFAVRPFYIKYPEKMINQTLKWAKSDHPKVRRLATEGCRPRLPWAIALPEFKHDPQPIIPILELLKDDEDKWVRKSVANNLNDISKDNPKIVLQLTKKWIGSSQNTDWIIKHGMRTLLKNGNQDALKLFGFGKLKGIKISDFRILSSSLSIGNDLEFCFDLHCQNKSKIRLEYAIYYLRNNGSHSRKIFKISEKEYPTSSVTKIINRQSFKIITTRKFYIGKHFISIVVNGKETERKEFYLEK